MHPPPEVGQWIRFFVIEEASDFPENVDDSILVEANHRIQKSPAVFFVPSGGEQQLLGGCEERILRKTVTEHTLQPGRVGKTRFGAFVFALRCVLCFFVHFCLPLDCRDASRVAYEDGKRFGCFARMET